MADGYGTPIRLLFDNPDNMAAIGYSGGMELSALSIALSVERKVGGMPMPFVGGKRFGIDLNRVNSTIIIEGIFLDDDANRRSVFGRFASAEIDFGVDNAVTRSVGGIPTIDSAQFTRLAGGVGQLVVTAQSGTSYTVSFVESVGAVGHIGGGVVRVRDTTPGATITATALATAVQDAINALAPGVFTMSTSTSTLLPIGGSTRLSITQTTKGTMPVSTPILFLNQDGFAVYHTQFKGGADDSTKNKSAGDKVQDLYGILHNTQRAGSAFIGGAVLAAGAVAGTLATGGAAAVVGGVGTIAGAGIGGGLLIGASNAFFVDGDYPIGLQIPYNSMIQAPDGQQYAARNFLIPTGLGKNIVEKTSVGNNNPASVEFDTTDNMTGIQGAIQKFDVGYAAGEQVYTYQMVFAPIDVLA